MMDRARIWTPAIWSIISNMMVVMFFIMPPAGEQMLRRFKISWITDSMLVPPISEGSGVKEREGGERERSNST